MKSHVQLSDIDSEHLKKVCRSGTPCSKLDFRSNESGTRITTCSKYKTVDYPSPINTGDQYTNCSGTPEYTLLTSHLNRTQIGMITGIIVGG